MLPIRMTANAVRRYVDEWGLGWWLVGMSHALIPGLLVWLFWGVWNPRAVVWYSVVEVGCALYWAIHGWEPWNMGLEIAFRGRKLAAKEYPPILRVTRAFFRDTRRRAIQFVSVASGAILPWIIGGITHSLNMAPIKPAYALRPWWAMGILGLVDASRGRTIAFRLLAKEFDKNWAQLRKNAEALDIDSRLAVHTEQGPIVERSLGSVSRSLGTRTIAWLLLLAAIALLSAYLQGRARRHGL